MRSPGYDLNSRLEGDWTKNFGADATMRSMWPETYYAVIFTSQRTPLDTEGYASTAKRMDELARAQPGFLGVESARGEDGLGITVSYWESLAAIEGWKKQVEHLAAQFQGRAKWYASFDLRVAKVERHKRFES